MKIYIKNKIDLKQMITQIFSLQDINKAVNTLKKGNCVRVLIDMSL